MEEWKSGRMAWPVWASVHSPAMYYIPALYIIMMIIISRNASIVEQKRGKPIYN